MPFGLSTAPRIFTMLLRPVLRMLRDINVSVIAYLDDLLIVGSTKEECLSNLKKTMDLLVKLGFKLNLEKSVLEPTQSITFLGLRIDSLSMKLLVPKEKKKSVINNPIEHVFKSSRNDCAVNGVSSTMSETEQLQAKDPNRQHYHSLIHQSPGWSDTRTISSVRTTLETMPQEESQLDWRAYSRILQCKSRPPKPSFRDKCTPPRLESMETMSGFPSTNNFAFYPGEDQLIQFDEGFYNTDISNMEINNMVSDDSSTSSSSSTSHVSSSSGYIPRSIDQTFSRVNTNSNSTTLETGDYSTFQSHVNSIFGTQNSGTSELLMKSWEQSTLKVYNSSFTRFLNFCTLNSLDPSNITLVVFMDFLTHLFRIKPPLAFSTINNHRSMLNQLLLLRNQNDIVNDPFITRIMTGIHKLRPSSAKYKEIWDANKVFTQQIF
ncbi:hypothetical protein ACTFIZ_007578 [Dictyostelium cf. discoideum]